MAEFLVKVLLFLKDKLNNSSVSHWLESSSDFVSWIQRDFLRLPEFAHSKFSVLEAAVDNGFCHLCWLGKNITVVELKYAISQDG